MTEGVKAIIYPVKDVAKAKSLFSELVGVEPYQESAYYVGFNIEGHEVGLDPRGHSRGMTGPVGYWQVEDINKSLNVLLEAGAEAHQEVTDVGGGKLIASVKDADGNVIGLLQSNSHRRDQINDELLTMIERELKSWPGVTTGDTGRGGLQFSYGRVELGHLHGSSFADLPFPKKVRDELIAQGRASVHPPLPESGWVRRSMEGPEDVTEVIELFRMNYERARARAEQNAV
jgi:predicted enzyme related to lactoylglutathione lyase